jgi:L-threonylcarbamoyladenylate synthase
MDTSSSPSASAAAGPRWHRVDPQNPEATEVAEASAALAASDLVILPTDTGYALCGLATDEAVLERVYRAKQRDRNKPIHVLVADLGMARRVAVLEPRVIRLMERLLPGPLTLVLPAAPELPRGLNRAGSTIGVRVPDLAFTLRVLSHLDAPVTATSANPSGGRAPYTSKDLAELPRLEGLRAIFDAGDLPHRRPSTIVEVLPGRPPSLLRAGPVELSTVLDAL